MKLDIEEIFGKTITSGYLWCGHCERAFTVEKVKSVRGEFGGTFQVCPYDDCGAGTIPDGRDWAEVREVNSEYPIIPIEGKIYSC